MGRCVLFGLTFAVILACTSADSTAPAHGVYRGHVQVGHGHGVAVHQTGHVQPAPVHHPAAQVHMVAAPAPAHHQPAPQVHAVAPVHHQPAPVHPAPVAHVQGNIFNAHAASTTKRRRTGTSGQVKAGHATAHAKPAQHAPAPAHVPEVVHAMPTHAPVAHPMPAHAPAPVHETVVVHAPAPVAHAMPAHTPEVVHTMTAHATAPAHPAPAPVHPAPVAHVQGSIYNAHAVSTTKRGRTGTSGQVKAGHPTTHAKPAQHAPAPAHVPEVVHAMPAHAPVAHPMPAHAPVPVAHPMPAHAPAPVHDTVVVHAPAPVAHTMPAQAPVAVHPAPGSPVAIYASHSRVLLNKHRAGSSGQLRKKTVHHAQTGHGAVVGHAVGQVQQHVVKVDGGWSAWSAWTFYGGRHSGIKHRTRGCRNPYPANGGSYCSGKPLETKSTFQSSRERGYVRV